LFEIFLLRERKNFSCSISSKNRVLYLFKNVSFSLRAPLFRSGKWCKGKSFFSNLQIFRKKFSKNFQNRFKNLAVAPTRFRSSLRGAKVNRLFQFSKFFGRNFQSIFKNYFQEPFAAFEKHSFLKAGAKMRQEFLICKFFNNFFRTFSGVFLHRINRQQITKRDFSRPKAAHSDIIIDCTGTVGRNDSTHDSRTALKNFAKTAGGGIIFRTETVCTASWNRRKRIPESEIRRTLRWESESSDASRTVHSYVKAA